MTETIERVITTGILRAAIRTKIDQGIAARAVSVLISAYANPLTGEGRDDGGVQRLPVETIPVERRGEFLRALNQLKRDDIPVGDAAIARGAA
jgi:hypothetical protein